MNDCCKNIDDYCDGLLDPELMRAFENHLANCPECRMRTEIEDGLNDRIRNAWSVVETSPPTRRKILEQGGTSVESQPKQKLANTRRMITAAIGLAASIILCIGIAQRYSFRFQNPVDPVAVQPSTVDEPATKIETDGSDNILESPNNAEQNQVVTVAAFDRTTHTICLVAPRTSSQFTIVNTYTTLDLTPIPTQETLDEHDFQ